MALTNIGGVMTQSTKSLGLTTKKRYPTEFHMMGSKGLEFVQNLSKQFPLISAIFTVAAGFFGFFTLTHFTISAVISSALLMSLATAFGIAIARDSSYWEKLLNSALEVGKCVAFMNTNN